MLYDKTSIKILREQLTKKLRSQAFVPHRVFQRGDTQTLAAYLWPLRPRDRTGDEERFFQVEPGSQVVARCRWQSNRKAHPTLVMWHGMEGSTASAYMVSTADKAFRAGFNVVRVNVRNCGGTEHLSPTLYHGGLTADVRVVVLDLTMPGPEADETLRALRQLRPDVRIILSSGYSEDAARRGFTAGDLAGFLQKPYRPQELVDMIRQALS